MFPLKGKHSDHKFTYIPPLFFDDNPEIVLNAHSEMQKSILNVKKQLEECILQLDCILEENKKMEQEFKEQNNVIKLSQLVDKIEDMGDSSSIEELLRIQVLTPNDY